MKINRDDEHEPAISTFANMQCLFGPNGIWPTPWMETDASPRRCDHKAISRTNNFYEVYPAPAARGYAWNVAPLLRKMAAGDARTFDPRLLELMPPFADLAPPALVIDKPVYSAFAGHHLHHELMRSHSDTLILTGAETDVWRFMTAPPTQA